MRDIRGLVARLRRGDKRAAARLITLLENRDPRGREAMAEIYGEAGGAHVIGITGSPGVGKSTLIWRLITELRRRGRKVGVITVDPTSPYSGGAFLGDRVRMQSHTTDPGVFIRSLATRGSPGGVSRATRDAVRVLEAWGAEAVLVETVGAGQSEVGVMGVADTVTLLLSPGAGDEIQSLKAGIMEIADVYAVNKADVEGADMVLGDVKRMLSMEETSPGWVPPIVKVSAKTGAGVPELLGELERHREYAETHPDEDEETRRARDEVLSIVRERAADHVIASLLGGDVLREAVRDVKEGRVDPYTSVERLLSSAATNPSSGSEDGGGLEIGLTHVYTGDGKGKTSAALGLALRAVGRGLRVHVVQFLKGHRDYGEHIVAERTPGLEITAIGRGEYIEGSPTPGDMALAAEALELAREIIGSGDYHVVVLDEVNIALKLGLIEKDAILEIIDSKPGNLELVLTGRGVPPEIVEAADLVTEMREVKHPFGKGIKARKGIEY